MAVKKDVIVKARIQCLVTEVLHKGSSSVRPGRDGRNGRQIVDIPEMILDSAEFAARIANATSVLTSGTELADADPPQASTKEHTGLASTSVTLRGRAESNNVSTAVGFQYGTTPGLSSSHAATGSPVQSEDPSDFTYALTGLTPSTTYFYRAYANDGTKTVYGRIKSFTTPPATE